MESGRFNSPRYRTKTAKPKKDFYERLIFVKKDEGVENLYIISEGDSEKGIRVSFYSEQKRKLHPLGCSLDCLLFLAQPHQVQYKPIPLGVGTSLKDLVMI